MPVIIPATVKATHGVLEWHYDNAQECSIRMGEFKLLITHVNSNKYQPSVVVARTGDALMEGPVQDSFEEAEIGIGFLLVNLSKFFDTMNSQFHVMFNKDKV